MQPTYAPSLQPTQAPTPDGPFIHQGTPIDPLPAYTPPARTGEEPEQTGYELLDAYYQKEAREWKRNPLLRKAALLQPEKLSPLEAEEAARYTDNGFTYQPGRDNDAIAGALQGGSTKFWNDAKMVGINALGTVGSWTLSFPQALKAIATGIEEQSFSKGWETYQGEPGSYLNDINQWMDEKNKEYTNYQSAWAQQNPGKNLIPFYGGEGGNDFGNLTRSLGFVIGGVATTVGEMGIATLLAPFTEGMSLGIAGASALNKLNRAFRSIKAIGKSLDTLSDVVNQSTKVKRALGGLSGAADAVWNGVKTPVGSFGLRSSLHGLLINNGEASMEGYGAEQEMLQSMRMEYLQKNGVNPSGDVWRKMQEVAKDAGNAAFTLNHALLGVTNHFQLGGILKSFPEAKRIFGESDDLLYRLEREAGTDTYKAVKNVDKPIWEVNPNDLWYHKAFKKGGNIGAKLGKSLLFGNLSEGIEEGLQSSIAAGTQDYYQLQYSGVGKGDFSEVINSTLKGLKHGFATSEGLTEVMGGILIGGVSNTVMQYAAQKKNDPLHKQLVEGLAEYANQGLGSAFRENAKQIQDYVNKGGVLGKPLMKKAVDARAAFTSTALSAGAANAGDQFIFQNLKASAQFGWIHGFVRSEATDIAKEELETLRADIQKDPQAVADAFGMGNISKEALLEAVGQLEQHVDTVEKLHKKYSTLYRNPYEKGEEHSAWDDLYTELLHNAFIQHTVHKRLQKLTQEVSERGDYGTVKKLVTPEGLLQYVDDLNKELNQLNVARQSLIDSIDNVDTRKPKDTGKKETITSDTGTVTEKPILETEAEVDERVKKELERATKALDKEQETQRKRLSKELEDIQKLKDSGYDDYEKLVDTLKGILEDPDGVYRFTPATREEVKSFLGKVYDGVQLENSIQELMKKHDQLTSKDALQAFIQNKNEFIIEEFRNRLKKEATEKNAFIEKVKQQVGEDLYNVALRNPEKRKAFLQKWFTQYRTSATPETVLQQIKEELEKNTSPELVAHFKALSKALTDLLVAKKLPDDPDEKQLQKLVEDTLEGIPDLLEYDEATLWSKYEEDWTFAVQKGRKEAIVLLDQLNGLTDPIDQLNQIVKIRRHQYNNPDSLKPSEIQQLLDLEKELSTRGYNLTKKLGKIYEEEDKDLYQEVTEHTPNGYTLAKKGETPYRMITRVTSPEITKDDGVLQKASIAVASFASEAEANRYRTEVLKIPALTPAPKKATGPTTEQLEAKKKIEKLIADGKKATLIDEKGDTPSHYKFLGKLYQRVSNFFSKGLLFKDANSVTNLKNSVVVGNYFDTFARLYYKNNNVTLKEFEAALAKRVDKKQFSKIDTQAIFEENKQRFAQIKQQIQKDLKDDNLLFFTDDIFVHADFKNEGWDGVAGTLDMVVVDSAGKIHVYDFKTKAENNAKYPVTKADLENTTYGESSQEKWTKQQSAYAKLLQSTFGYIPDINIIVLPVSYTKEAFTGDPSNKAQTDAFTPSPSNVRLSATAPFIYSLTFDKNNKLVELLDSVRIVSSNPEDEQATDDGLADLINFQNEIGELAILPEAFEAWKKANPKLLKTAKGEDKPEEVIQQEFVNRITNFLKTVNEKAERKGLNQDSLATLMDESGVFPIFNIFEQVYNRLVDWYKIPPIPSFDYNWMHSTLFRSELITQDGVVEYVSYVTAPKDAVWDDAKWEEVNEKEREVVELIRKRKELTEQLKTKKLSELGSWKEVKPNGRVGIFEQTVRLPTDRYIGFYPDGSSEALLVIPIGDTVGIPVDKVTRSTNAEVVKTGRGDVYRLGDLITGTNGEKIFKDLVSNGTLINLEDFKTVKAYYEELRKFWGTVNNNSLEDLSLYLNELHPQHVAQGLADRTQNEQVRIGDLAFNTFNEKGEQLIINYKDGEVTKNSTVFITNSQLLEIKKILENNKELPGQYLIINPIGVTQANRNAPKYIEYRVMAESGVEGIQKAIQSGTSPANVAAISGTFMMQGNPVKTDDVSFYQETNGNYQLFFKPAEEGAKSYYSTIHIKKKELDKVKDDTVKLEALLTDFITRAFASEWKTKVGTEYELVSITAQDPVLVSKTPPAERLVKTPSRVVFTGTTWQWKIPKAKPVVTPVVATTQAPVTPDQTIGVDASLPDNTSITSSTLNGALENMFGATPADNYDNDVEKYFESSFNPENYESGQSRNPFEDESITPQFIEDKEAELNSDPQGFDRERLNQMGITNEVFKEYLLEQTNELNPDNPEQQFINFDKLADLVNKQAHLQKMNTLLIPDKIASYIKQFNLIYTESTRPPEAPAAPRIIRTTADIDAEVARLMKQCV